VCVYGMFYLFIYLFIFGRAGLEALFFLFLCFMFILTFTGGGEMGMGMGAFLTQQHYQCGYCLIHMHERTHRYLQYLGGICNYAEYFASTYLHYSSRHRHPIWYSTD